MTAIKSMAEILSINSYFLVTNHSSTSMLFFIQFHRQNLHVPILTRLDLSREPGLCTLDACLSVNSKNQELGQRPIWPHTLRTSPYNLHELCSETKRTIVGVLELADPPPVHIKLSAPSQYSGTYSNGPNMPCPWHLYLQPSWQSIQQITKTFLNPYHGIESWTSRGWPCIK